MFRPARHKWLAKIVTFETTSRARKAASRLVNMLKRGRRGSKKITRRTALTIVKALNLAANRARASAKRHNLTRQEKHKLLVISRIYRRAAEKASKIYHEKYGKGR